MKSNKPLLIMFIGLPLLGKSTLSKAVSEKLNIPRVSTDEVLCAIKPNSNFNEEDRKIMYFTTYLIIKYLLAQKQSVIVDGAYTNFAKYKEVQDTFLGNIVRSEIIFWFKPDLDLMLERFKNRKNHPAIDLNEKRIRMLFETRSIKPDYPNVFELSPYDSLDKTLDLVINKINEMKNGQNK